MLRVFFAYLNSIFVRFISSWTHEQRITLHSNTFPLKTQDLAEVIFVMGGAHPSNGHQTGGDGDRVMDASNEIKNCYYEILGVDRSASDEEYANLEVMDHVLLMNSEG